MVLELTCCYDVGKFLLELEYPNLTTLIIKSSIGRELLQTFIMRRRSIKKVSCGFIDGNILPLIARDAPEVEVLSIYPQNLRNLMSLVQLKKLKRLEIGFFHQKSIITLMKGLSVNNKLDMLGIRSFGFTDEFCNALSNLTNLKKLHLSLGIYP